MSATVIEDAPLLDLSTVERDVPPWSRIETVTTITAKTSTAKMLSEAGLNGWNISLVPLSELVEGYRFMDEAFAVVRKGKGRNSKDSVMGIVGSRYQPVQNEEIFAFGDALLKAGSGVWSAAGPIKDGKVVFGVLETGREVLVGGIDPVSFYLMVNSSHDGSVSLSVTSTPVRSVSQSVMNLILPGVEQAFKLRHTPSVSEANRLAQEAIMAADIYQNKFEAVANALFAKKLTEKQFDNLIQIVYPKPSRDTKGAMSRWNSKRRSIQEIWEGSASPVDTMEGIRGTAWGALCTMIERMDYHRAPRMDNVENLLVSASGFDAMTNQEKNRITQAVLKYAKVG